MSTGVKLVNCPRKYKQAGIEILVPTVSQQKQIDEILFNELVKNVVTLASKQIYIDICLDLVSKGAQGVILGCSEIFLLIKPEDFAGLPLFNTTELHVDAVVAVALVEH